MTKFLCKILACTAVFLMSSVGSSAQIDHSASLTVQFANGRISANGLTWTFDLQGKGIYNYLPPKNNWQELVVRIIIEVPNGGSIVSGTGTLNPTYASGLAGFQVMPRHFETNLPRCEFSLHRENQTDLNPNSFVTLATYSVTFSEPVTPDVLASWGYGNNVDADFSYWKNTDQVKRFVNMPPGFPLPVKLTHFSAETYDNYVELNWSTSEETNAEFFEVQHSTDGKSWTSLGQTTARGREQALTGYSFHDGNPSGGLNYYRLKMVDRDGSFALSKIASVSLTRTEAMLSLYPNPSEGRITIRHGRPGQVFTIEIQSLSSKKVYTAEIESGKEINLEHLDNGLYIARIRERENSMGIKLLINR